MKQQESPEDVPAVPDEASLLRTLREHFGMSTFRPGQLSAIRATLAREDALVILPTGGGKSVAFQLPCHTRTHGFTVVVCPLLALAKDQVDKCDERGIYAERWNCEVPEPRKTSIAKDLVCDEPSVRLLYTTPESLQTPKLLECLKEACANGNLVSFAVDEAHTVSEWGHDFRPAYLQLSMIKQEFPSVPVVALTASATPKVRDDIISVLRLKQPQVIKGSFNRPNIAYQVRHKELLGDGSDNAALEDLVKYIQERNGEGGIVYARLRATCDWLASSLAAHDIDVGCYHAGKNNDMRARVQRDWSSGGTNVVVATIAFGMGIDRADVRWVVHWNAPTSMEGFYQESGRAGRDGLPSASLLYASKADLEANQKMERGARAGAVAEVAAYCHGGGCRRRHVLKFFGEDRGPCDRSTDALCDACTDPRAVARALSRLEAREADTGNRAAQIRAKMLGIKVAAPGEDGDDDGDGGSGGAKRRGGAHKALWASANSYSAAAAASGESGSDSDAADAAAGDNTGAAAGRNSRGAGAGGAQQQGTAVAAGAVVRQVAAAPAIRRPTVLKRPTPLPPAAVATEKQSGLAGGARALEDIQGEAAAGKLRQQPRPEMADDIADEADGEEEVTGPPPQRDATEEERPVLASRSALAARQPLLKRPRPSVGAVQLPFKAPERVGAKPVAGGTALSDVGAGRSSSGARGTSSSGVQGPGVGMEAEAAGGVGPEKNAPAATPFAGAAGGAAMRRRWGFVPPARVGPGKLGEER